MSEPLSEARVRELLSCAIEGDIARIGELKAASQEQLHAAGQSLGGSLTLGRPAVLRVVRNWRDGHLTDEMVRLWALLMTVGAFPDEWSPYGWRVHHSHPPVDIDYSDDVSEVLSRLRDLGDFDDTGRTAADFDFIIRQLSDS